MDDVADGVDENASISVLDVGSVLPTAVLLTTDAVVIADVVVPSCRSLNLSSL